MIAIGEIAPDFTLPATQSAAATPETQSLTLSDLKGGWVVLYFYPRDDTPGCTTEALDFTRLSADFAAAGATIVGISKDTIEKHRKFCAKHGLGIWLASDAEGDTCERYGTWAEKNMYGKVSMGIVRTTVLIDPEGRIVQIWPKVKVKGHAEAVLQTLRETA